MTAGASCAFGSFQQLVVHVNFCNLMLQKTRGYVPPQPGFRHVCYWFLLQFQWCFSTEAERLTDYPDVRCCNTLKTFWLSGKNLLFPVLISSHPISALTWPLNDTEPWSLLSRKTNVASMNGTHLSLSLFSFQSLTKSLDLDCQRHCKALSTTEYSPPSSHPF